MSKKLIKDGADKQSVLTRVLRPTLLQAGYIVVTYNARGVGKSAGWQSWVGGGEGEDASEVARWAWEMMGCNNADKGTLLSCVRQPSLEEATTDSAGLLLWLSRCNPVSTYTSNAVPASRHSLCPDLAPYLDHFRFRLVASRSQEVPGSTENCTIDPGRVR